jgi:hypothetical protein
LEASQQEPQTKKIRLDSGIPTLLVRKRRLDQVVEKGLEIPQAGGKVRRVRDTVDGIVEYGDTRVKEMRRVGLHCDLEDLFAVALSAIRAGITHQVTSSVLRLDTGKYRAHARRAFRF